MNCQHKLCLDNTKHLCHFFCFTSSRNKVCCYGRLLEHLESSGTKIMMRGSIVRQLWWEDLLYASYDERTYCTPVMMRGPIVCQLWWEDLLYASYDERTYCTPVMMRGPIVCQLWWEDLLYASYDERTYCTSVMMRGPIVCQLYVGKIERNKEYLEDKFHIFYVFLALPVHYLSEGFKACLESFWS